MNVFPTADGYRIALTYGPETDWVRNVLAADGCELQTRGRSIRLVKRQILRIIGVADFLALMTAPATPTTFEG